LRAEGERGLKLEVGAGVMTKGRAEPHLAPAAVQGTLRYLGRCRCGAWLCAKLFFFFWVALEFELRASSLLGRCS
jgi:hypothetical protein